MYVCVHTCMYGCEGQRSTSSVIFYHSPPQFLRQGCLLNWMLIVVVRWAGQWPPSIHPPVSILWKLRLEMCTVMPRLYVGTGDLQSSPHDCKAGTILTEASTSLSYLLNLPSRPVASKHPYLSWCDSMTTNPSVIFPVNDYDKKKKIFPWAYYWFKEVHL